MVTVVAWTPASCANTYTLNAGQMMRKAVRRSRWYTHLCTPSLLIDVYMGQITHNHLVATLPAVRHHCITKRVHMYDHSDVTKINSDCQ